MALRNPSTEKSKLHAIIKKVSTVNSSYGRLIDSAVKLSSFKQISFGQIRILLNICDKKSANYYQKRKKKY